MQTMSRSEAAAVEVVEKQPGRLYRRVIVLICLYALAALAVLPVASGKGPDIPAITSIFAAVTLITELSTAFLLFVWFREVRTWALLLLGCAYL